MTSGPALAMVVAAALHAGFQLTVTLLVYPVLVSAPTAAWDDAHARHSRLVVPLVLLSYGGLVGAGTWLLAVDRAPAALAAVAPAAACVLVTALGAAPIHGRLRRPDPRLLRRLLVVDRVRAGAAVLSVAAAVMAATG
ncbi:hypothetical protein NSZ01_34960 [Nocardioides szechwanensis]|uniref:DUF1772 domain-containing protein n=1 Tax=Nocardioides szechwanensis TaxID=1005944 RepID=A0A1H0FN42_9ACTN|nr:hypothetical protein [Nocardioides szechwanensis]GEP35728.1 hypothetical protein NSZ01_34960 [Nocardioides szechwanensis]SDN96168.1 hypothetical protein SAMN05192576_3090 [Nocardioides szechwanensis]